MADLFAGSGALGLEALSRGAAFACFVENEPSAAAAIAANAAQLGALDRVEIRGGSALALPASEPFHLVFADPPYEPGSGTAAVRSVAAAGWLAPGGWMAVETARMDEVDPSPLSIDSERIVGAARLTLLQRST